MKVAVFGCLHGMLDEMYAAVERSETPDSRIDFILVCGDCQTLRHPDDLKCLSVPNKFKKLGDFHEYYSGKKKIPKLTIFIGGNHEASNYLMTLPYGGWVCDNFYYLGYSGVVRYKGLRIAGVSGIYNYHNCNKGRYERMPLNEQSIKSIYHTRRLDVFRLQLLSANADSKDPIDVFMSHDWPTRIYEHGNVNQLLRFKPHFRSDVESRNGLGSPQIQPLVSQLKPKRWFAAHLHCRFYAKVVHDQSNGRCTEFLSLNKIENKRHFMEVLDMSPTRQYDESDDDLYYDEEWLTILRKTIDLEKNCPTNIFCPNIEDANGQAYAPTADEIQETLKMMDETGGLKIKKNFRMTEPVIYNRPNGIQPSMDRDRVKSYPNFQFEELCSRLQLSGGRNVKTEPTFKQEQGTSVKIETGIKKEENDVKVETEIKRENGIKEEVGVKTEHGIGLKTEHGIGVKHEPKIEVGENSTPPTKRRALTRATPELIELDDDGCLPFYIDTKGDK